jgi:hypothetical protein
MVFLVASVAALRHSAGISRDRGCITCWHRMLFFLELVRDRSVSASLALFPVLHPAPVGSISGKQPEQD